MRDVAWGAVLVFLILGFIHHGYAAVALIILIGILVTE